MARQPRGTGYLLLGAVALVILTFSGLSWISREGRRPAVLQIFHWVPTPGPLKIVGNPPFTPTPGTDLSGAVGPELFFLLAKQVPTGELRLVGELPISSLVRSKPCALILSNELKSPHTLYLFNSYPELYLEQTTGNSGLPAGAPTPKGTITLTPGKNSQPGWLDFLLMDPSGAGSSGSIRTWWW